MKKSGLPVFIVVMVVVTLVVAGGIYYLASGLLKQDNKTQKAAAVQCQTKGPTHQVNIKDNQARPDHVDAKLCDVLVINNQDDRVHLMAFGQHDNHIYYDGISEKELSKDDNITVTLNQTGTYEFHDHIGDVAEGNFTVTK